MATNKKLDPCDSFKLYKSMYKEKFQWDDILPTPVLNYVCAFEGAQGCPLTLQMSALLPLFAITCGPGTTLRSLRMTSPSNIFIIGICAPGGGKSPVFQHIMDPCLQVLEYEDHLSISPQIETYTTAGLQEHQQETKGYGIIATAEGHRVIQNINSKVSKGEGERSLLCKLWDGVGDHTCSISGKKRGFKSTCMSMCLLVQPDMLFNELVGMCSNDGFLDRLIFMCERVNHKLSNEVQTAHKKLQGYGKDVFPKAVSLVFKHHFDKEQEYIFDQKAQATLNDMDDSFALTINARYASSDEGQKNIDNSQGQLMQGESSFYTSKDNVHISRLCLVMHLFLWSMASVLKSSKKVCKPCSVISYETLQLVTNMFYTMANQKTLLLQGIESTQTFTTVNIKLGKTGHEKVKYQLCKSIGPIGIPRDIQRNTALTATQVKVELEKLAADGKGSLHLKKSASWCNTDLYFKPLSEDLDSDDTFLKGCCSRMEYEAKFSNLSKLSRRYYKLLNHHPLKTSLPFPLDDESTNTSTDSDASHSTILRKEESQTTEHLSSQESSSTMVSSVGKVTKKRKCTTQARVSTRKCIKPKKNKTV